MANPMSSLIQHSRHLGANDEVCPWCEQAITHDKFEEISEKIAREEADRLAEIQTRLAMEFAEERNKLAADAQTRIDTVTRLGEEATARAVREAKLVADRLVAQAEEKLGAAVVQSRHDVEAAMADKVRTAEEAAIQSARDKQAAEIALNTFKAAAEGQAAEVADRHKAELETAVANAEDAIRQRASAVVTELKTRLQATETARQLSHEAAEERLRAVEKERADLQEQLVGTAAAHEVELTERTNEIRDSLSREMSKAVLDVKAAAFAEKQKLTEAVDDLKRQLERKTAAELGEGSEIDLFEALREAFDGDNIRRVPKGENGADVVHEIVVNGTICGTIVYDSKNRNAWQNNFASKLYSDMIAARADHAILSTNKFPTGTRQLHVLNGVIIACPARVVALVQLLRAHIVQTHALRVSAEQREEKTAALYDYVTSERCSLLMDSMHVAFEKLEAIDVDERKSHDTVWNKRGRLLKEVERTRGTMVYELQRIIGTAEAAE
ncbi:DUF2130 domain-containing protein [Devosia sediminis]|uniref:DUF2130 domain-containing protein n=1 Tax=Devosia sediminis TaxID=2798801 RepID=A0A934J2C3_9HYPH|nr:DUF2130 domain-containing protein [Devosia sediminis]MBJ3786389.1 DUF2130 domain-containing protein [Devosia sediminis]